MKLICPECKSEVDLKNYPDLEKDQIIECDICGISLRVVSINDDKEVETEIEEEGK